MRTSSQRNIILDVVNASCDHPNADMILSRAKKYMPSINLATVYRNLSQLVDCSMVLRIPLPDGDRFDKTLSPHAHFHCVACGKVFDVDVMKSDIISDIENASDIRIEKIDIILSGLCSDCK